MGNIYKMKAKRLKGDPYIGVCFQALETLEHLYLIQARSYNIHRKLYTHWDMDAYIILAKTEQGRE